MHPARRRLVFLSAAIAAVAAVLALILPAAAAPAAAVSAAGNRVGASHPQTIPAVGVSNPVLPGQDWCGGLPQAQVAVDACVAPEDTVDLYHGTSAESAANIRSNGIDLGAGRSNLDFGRGFYTTRDPEQAATWAARHYGESGMVLHYSVPSSMFDSLSGRVFEEADSDYLDMVYSMRSGGPMHAYDYVEGPLLGNPGDFLAGKEPITFGNQVSFHTETAVNQLNGYLQP